MRPHGAAPTYRYLGADPLRETPDGFVTIGDMGWLDGDGYLFVADRRADLVITGGANVYPAEVEAALLEHPGVADVAVVGLPDDDLGRVVHAVVQANDPASPPSTEDLDAFVKERISGYKAPRSYELVEELPRDDSGKIRRSALIATRDAIDVSGSD
jgi:bile acid-coenzyme A ligase